MLAGASLSYPASNVVVPPRLPGDAKQPVIWLLSSNDGFGHNYGTDEDNLRTYGINAGAAFRRPFLISADWTSFTDRNFSIEKSLRIDELKIAGACRLPVVSNRFMNVTVYTGIGSLLYGNFGTLRLQENAHGINNEHPRPVPETYDTGSSHLIAYGFSEIGFPLIFSNVRSYAHITHRADWNVNLTAGWWMVRNLLQSEFTASYRWGRVDHAGSAAGNCYDRENGVWMASRTYIGPLLLERGVNLSTLNQYSYAGFRLLDYRKNDGPHSPFGFSYSLGWPIGHNSWDEFFRYYPFESHKRIGFFLRTYHTENLIANNITNLDDDRHFRRTKETSLGTEIAFNDPDEWRLLDGFIFGGAGFTRDALTTYDQLEARILKSTTSFMVHAGCGLRLQLPDLIYKNFNRTIGAELRANYRYNARNTGIFSNPDFLLSWGLVFSDR
jgi:hypothetical protein